MSLLLNPHHITLQVPTLTLNEDFIGEFLAQKGNFLSLTYLQEGPTTKAAFVLQFQNPPSAYALQESFCFFYKLITVNRRPLLQVGFPIKEQVFQSFLLLEHVLVRSVLQTALETGQIFFILFHEDDSVSVHQLDLSPQDLAALERALRATHLDLSLLTTGDALLKALLKNHETELSNLMTLVGTKNLSHLNLSKPRIPLEKPPEKTQKTGS